MGTLLRLSGLVLGLRRGVGVHAGGTRCSLGTGSCPMVELCQDRDLVPQPRSQDRGRPSPGARALGLQARSVGKAADWVSSGPWDEAGKMWSSERQFCPSGPLATWAQGRVLRSQGLLHRAAWSLPPTSPLTGAPLPVYSPSPAPLILSPSTPSPSPWHFRPRSVGANRQRGGSVRERTTKKGGGGASSQCPHLGDGEGMN